MTATPAPSCISAPIADSEWSIEFLRGIAALMVLYAHYRVIGEAPTSILDFSFSGVDLFFAISGFVFAPYFFGKKIDITPFFVRRLFRIYPLYCIALGIYIALHYANNKETDHILKHLLFLHTLEKKEIAFYYNPAFWSLPPEIEFYITIPILCAFFQGTQRVVALLAISSLIHFGLVSQLGAGNMSAKAAEISLFHLPGVMGEFLVGTLAWKVVSLRPSRLLRISLILFGFTLWTTMALIFVRGGDASIESSWWLRGNIGLLSALAYALVIAGAAGWIRQAPPHVDTISQALGNLSFGVYLFHNALPSALTPFFEKPAGPLFAIACATGTLAISYIGHHCWEEPLRQRGRIWASKLRTQPSIKNGSRMNG